MFLLTPLLLCIIKYMHLALLYLHLDARERIQLARQFLHPAPPSRLGTMISPSNKKQIYCRHGGKFCWCRTYDSFYVISYYFLISQDMLCHLVVFTKVRDYLCQYLESNGRSICWDYNSSPSLDISFSHTYVYPPSPPPFLVQRASLVCLFLQSLISASWIGSLVNVRNNKLLQLHM